MSAPATTIAVLGASGRTGRWIVQEALERGYTVRAIVRDPIVRDPAGRPLRHERLQVVQGTPTDEQVLREALTGCQAVLSALNISRTSDFPWSPLRSPAELLSGTMQKVLPLCRELGIRRLLVVTAWGVHETKQDMPGWFRFLIENSNLKVPYRDHERQEALIEASALDWTLVRPVGLTNAAGQQPVQVTLDSTTRPSLTISRRSVARFLLDSLDQQQYIRQKPVISSI
jgi:putative NADH-flavin reductase